MPTPAEREARLLAEIQASMEAGTEAGVIRVRISDEQLDGRTIRVNGRDLVNFGSCSYLGLGQDRRLKDAAIAAVERFGPSYSSSATYAAVELYSELEALLSEICHGHPVIPAPTTTLMHLAALPSLVRSTDAVIIDIQAHASLRLSTDVLRGRGVRMKTVPHNDVAAMRRAAGALLQQHERVWVLIDGLYSMYGDIAPAAAISDLLDEYPGLYAYFDDAHGFGWAGDHGVGVVLDQIELSERMFVAISLSKAFGAGGGALVCGSRGAAETIKHTGGTLTFGGPIHPAVLGAGIAAARVLLSSEHADRQKRLYERIDLTIELLREHELVSPSSERTPVFFVEIGSVDRAIRMAKIMMLSGFYVNVSGYPVVPRGHAGIRIAVRADHEPADVRELMKTLATYVRLPEDIDLDEISVEELTR